MAKKKTTPIRQQYLEIKRQYPDAIVFFRLGDFYETFDQDAETAARELDLVLTGRNVGKNQRVPMAGVPHHAAEGYIAKLIAKGYKVALCEQIGTESVSGLMPRDVTRVFTAGTVIESSMLDATRNNYLAAVVLESERFGLAYVDVTTGEFATAQLDGRRSLTEELARLNPAELLIADNEHSLGEESALSQAVSRLPGWRFEEGNARETLLRHFQVNTLAGYGCDGKPLAVRAAGAVITYLNDTQRGMLSQIQRLATYDVSGYMALDAASRRNLELTKALDGGTANSLLGVLDKSVTAMGKRLMRSRVNRPLLALEKLNHRLDLVDVFYDDGLMRAETRVLLKGFPDLERLGNRTLNKTANPRDLEAIGRALDLVPDLVALFANHDQRDLEDPGSNNPTHPLFDLLGGLDPCRETRDLIEEAIVEDAPTVINKSGIIRAGFSAELDGVMNSSAHARDWVANLESVERKRTGISSLKVGFNKVFGYYIEITKANSDQAPDDYIRKQTLTNAERYITPDLKEYETLILNAEERILEIERRLFAEIRDKVAIAAGRLLGTSHVIAELDISAALAEVAANHDFVRPELGEDESLNLVDSRHPVVERAQILERFVPNDCRFDVADRIQIITGPNMSGKSTYLRQVALIVLMAQIGSYVPAKKAHIGLTDRIFTRIGAHDELHAGRSTFMVEMVEAAEILNHATNRSLLILDEIGRGTSTYDGLSIAWAMVEYLHNHPRLRPRTLFATHYHELTGLADFLPSVGNYNVAVAEEGDRVVFLHKIIPGGADRSYGIHVAQLAGLPRDVINRANEVLKDLERHAPTAAVEPSHLQQLQQIALFPESSPILDELQTLDVSTITPLEAINKLYEWKRRYTEEDQNPEPSTDE
jgi:DNA mismatch repair protein MutS